MLAEMAARKEAGIRERKRKANERSKEAYAAKKAAKKKVEEEKKKREEEEDLCQP